MTKAKTDKPDTKAAEDLLEEARKRFKLCEDREQKNWDRAKEAIRFRALEQWPDAIKRDRETPNQAGGPRPCPVIDKTNQYVRRIVNEMRRNTPAIRFRPTTGDASIEVAEVFDGIARHIQDISDAKTIYATAGEHAVDGGFGYWRVMTEYCDPESFDQEILIKGVPNRFTVLLGPHDEPDGSDAKYGFVFEDMPTDDFKARYPDKQPRSFPDAARDYPGWFGDETVRVCEYIRIVEKKCTICLLDDGSVMDKEEYERHAKAFVAASPLDVAPEIVKEREAVRKSVKWDKITATDVLESGELLGKYLPIIKVVGNDLVMPDGKHRISGLVESAMDAQRLHNYSVAKFIEAVALAPISSYVAAAGQVEKHPEWQDANRLPYPVLKYDPIDVNGEVVPPPRREAPAGIPAGWQQLLLDTEHGIEAATGMYGASIGGPSRERSGVALEGQQQQGELGSYHYPDNLSRSIRQTGRILCEWIPLYYDSQRAARILGDDGESSIVQLNPDQEQAVQEQPHTDPDKIGKTFKSFNLNVGKYDVTPDAGPSFLSKREEASKFAMELTRADPTLLEKAGDKIFRLFDVWGMDEIADRLKMFLPPQVLAAEAKGNKKMDPAVMAAMQQAQQAMQQAHQMAQQVGQAQQQLQVEASQVGADKTTVEAKLKELQAQQRILIADFQRAQAQIEAAGLKLIEQIRSLLLQPEAPKEPAAEPQPDHSAELIASNQATMQQVVEEIGRMIVQANTELAQSMAGALQGVATAVTRPRATTLHFDPQGNVIGGTSQ
jgi:hypothetical protein